MSDFTDPPAFTPSDVNNLTGLITKLTQLREVVQRIIGTVGPNRGSPAWGGGSGRSTLVLAGGTGSGSGGTPDLTPPPTPTGFSVGAAISHIFVSCDNQVYTQGGGHLYTRVYGATYTGSGPLPTFGGAVLIDTFPGTIEAIPENPATEWHLWITWVTIAGVEGPPAGGTNGLTATTGVDVTSLLNALTGKITQSQLYATLGSRIDLIDAVASTPGSVNARIATETSARVTTDGVLLAQWTVKLDVNGYVSGFGLASTGGSAAPLSQFIVRADSFSISNPTGPGISPVTPFVVQTVPTTINGQSVPVGVYMSGAYIQNGTITNAQIGHAAIDDALVANLSASKLIAGSLAVGQYIQSTSFVTGSAGWRISGNGVAEFAAASIRGQLAATQIAAGSIDASKIDSRGLTIQDAAGNVIFGVNVPRGSDAASALGFNPSFSAWLSTYPDNWFAWTGPAPTKNTSTLLPGSPYTVQWTVSGDDGMFRFFTYPTSAPLPPGSYFTGMFSMYMLQNNGGGKPGYLVRLYTDAALTVYVDNVIPIPNQAVGGWQQFPWTATAGGAAIYAIYIFQMASWVGMPGGPMANGSRMVFGPFSFDVKTPVDAGQIVPAGGWLNSNVTVDGSGLLQGIGSGAGTAVANSLLNASIADKISKSAPSILASTVSLSAAAGAGFVAGTLTWDSAGNRTGGSGVALTPGGIIGTNASGTPTFSINASSGNAFFGGTLSTNIVDTPQIVPSAVTNVGAFFNAAGFATDFSLTHSIASLTMTTTGAPLTVHIGFNNSIGSGTTTIDFRRDGTTIYGALLSSVNTNYPFSFSFNDTPGAGSHTYDMQVHNSSVTGTASFRSIVVVESKR